MALPDMCCMSSPELRCCMQDGQEFLKLLLSLLEGKLGASGQAVSSYMSFAWTDNTHYRI